MAENPPPSLPDARPESPGEPADFPETANELPAPRVPRRRRKRVILAVIAVAVVIGGWAAWRYFSSYESTDDAQVDVHLYPVSARVAGYVVRVNVDDNQWVKKGTVLVEIDPTDYEVAVAQAKANLANAEGTAESLHITVPITSVNTSSQLQFTASGIEDADAGIIAAERQVAAAHAQLESAQAIDVKAQDDLHRYKLLVDKKEVADQVYDQALAAARSSTAALAAAAANESAAKQFVQEARSRLAQANANHQYAPDRIATSVVDPGAGAGGHRRRRGKARLTPAGPTQSPIHKNPCPGQRRSQ